MSTPQEDKSSTSRGTENYFPAAVMGERARLYAKQPSPHKGARAVDPVANSLFAEMSVAAAARGMETYGTKLETQNGRSAVVDAMEEAVDTIKYLTQIRMELCDALRIAHDALLVPDVTKIQLHIALWKVHNLLSVMAGDVDV